MAHQKLSLFQKKLLYVGGQQAINVQKLILPVILCRSRLKIKQIIGGNVKISGQQFKYFKIGLAKTAYIISYRGCADI